MSFQGLTPEVLVERADSKNPATTCKGLTSSGRPCRRGIGSTPEGSPNNTPLKSLSTQTDTNGVVAILNKGDAAAFFCWQHKDQAENLVAKIRRESQRTKIVPLQKRSSIDTLAEKVGVLELDADIDRTEQTGKHGSASGASRKKKRRDTLPQEWQKVQGPLMTVPEGVVEEALATPNRAPRRRTGPKQENYGRSNVKASWGCCIRADEGYDDDGPPARRRERLKQQSPTSPARPQPSMISPHSSRPAGVAQTQMQKRPISDTHRHPQPLTPARPISRPTAPASSPPHTQTQSFLSLIPSHLNPNTTSALLSELSKPFAKDDEAGFIYIFWLTPTSEDSTPDDDLASTILDGDLDYQDDFRASYNSSRLRDSTARSRARALDRYASVKKHEREPPKILLKIGRAQNVHRRMTQWTKQCNQNITLVRYYPHYASAAADPRGPSGAKVPHVNRVERLIHLELRGMGMGKDAEKCAECGREHREWFQVPGTRHGLRGVDGVVRRWVQWAENLPSERADIVSTGPGRYY